MSSVPYCSSSIEQPLRIAARRPSVEARPTLGRAQTSPLPRPLPPIPKPRSFRPLPLLPQASSSSSQVSPPSSRSSRRPKTALPAVPVKPPSRLKPPILTVQTSPNVLRRAPSPNLSVNRQPSRRSSMTSIVSPLSTSIPCPPTPHTARKRQVLKVERRLGEKVPMELIQGSRKAGRVKGAQNQASSDDCMMYKAAMFAKRLADDDNVPLGLHLVDDGKAGRKEFELEDRVHVLSFGTTGPSLSGRQSTHWVWDKGGSRWETTLEDVLRTLRSL